MWQRRRSVRQDGVLPGYLALGTAIGRVYRLDHLPSQDEAPAIAEPWRRYQTLATSYEVASALDAGRTGRETGPPRGLSSIETARRPDTGVGRCAANPVVPTPASSAQTL
jgi:hypothetical protein